MDLRGLWPDQGCVWVLASACLLMGPFVLAKSVCLCLQEGVCACVFVFAECGGGRERWPGCHSEIRVTGAPSSRRGSSDCRFKETK